MRHAPSSPLSSSLFLSPLTESLFSFLLPSITPPQRFITRSKFTNTFRAQPFRLRHSRHRIEKRRSHDFPCFLQIPFHLVHRVPPSVQTREPLRNPRVKKRGLDVLPPPQQVVGDKHASAEILAMRPRQIRRTAGKYSPEGSSREATRYLTVDSTARDIEAYRLRTLPTNQFYLSFDDNEAVPKDVLGADSSFHVLLVLIHYHKCAVSEEYSAIENNKSSAPDSLPKENPYFSDNPYCKKALEHAIDCELDHVDVEGNAHSG